MADDAFTFPGGASAGGAAAPAGYFPPGPPQRHPLGLPRGSVRAVMILMVLGTIVTLLVMPPEKKVVVPVYMYYLLFLTAGAYFSGRGASLPRQVTREAPPLGLPGGSIRFVLVIGFLGGVGWAIYQAIAEGKFDDFLHRLAVVPANPLGDDSGVLDKAALLTPILMLGAFFLGTMTERFARMVLGGPEGLPGWYQDIQAWLSIVSMLLLGAEIVLQLIVFPSMPEERRVALPQFQAFLASIVAFYFGARS